MMTMIVMAYVGDRFLDPISGTLAHLINSKTERKECSHCLRTGEAFVSMGIGYLFARTAANFRKLSIMRLSIVAVLIFQSTGAKNAEDLLFLEMMYGSM